ncbi:DUF2911 domain-containing protein [Silvibacterium acidisoli]|uniref:DUF2911 domain-containing protein n=1 Tax=Acidobacteriaceae bacterium ZG23-2 TaxID=2883246 RepID=UPI00406D0E7F
MCRTITGNRRPMVTLAVAILAFASQVHAQNNKPRPSPPMKATATLEGKAISIDYGAPSMRGRQIVGGLVPYDKVWRTGANEATTLKTAVDIKIGDLSVPAGTYTVYSLPSESGWKLIINKQTGQWGTVYNENQDLGRVAMEAGPKPSAPVEQFEIKLDPVKAKARPHERLALHLIWENTDEYVTITPAK